MEKIVKVKVTDIGFKARRSVALIVEIDIFRFTKEMESDYILIDIETNGGYEYLDEKHLDVANISMESLEIVAKNWIFKHVEIVKEEELDNE